MKHIKLKRIEQGVCPYCGSTNINYDSAELDDEMVSYPATCNRCKRNFVEWYHLDFVGHNVGDNLDTLTDAGDEDIEILMNEPVPTFNLMPTVIIPEAYFNLIGCPKSLTLDKNLDTLTLDKFDEIMADFDDETGISLWNYPLTEMDYCIEEVGGKFVIVEFAFEDEGKVFRLCQVSE